MCLLLWEHLPYTQFLGLSGAACVVIQGVWIYRTGSKVKV